MLLARVGLVLACASLVLACGSDPYPFSSRGAAEVIGPTLIQTARPTSCPDGTQPAILRLQGAARTPEWGCLPGCPASQEFVSNVDRTIPGIPLLEPACHFVCAADQHRTSYIDFGGKAHCAPGAVTDEAQQATFARERRSQEIRSAEDRRQADRVARKKAEDEQHAAEELDRKKRETLAQLERDVRAMETTPVPWSFELIQKQHALTVGLRPTAHSRGLDGFLEDTHLDAITVSRLADRAAATEAKRVESEAILGVVRGRRQPATTRAMRIETCRSSCDAAVSCERTCPEVPASACDACRQGVVECRRTCGYTF
jgi:F0F1-type ATP synthase epsilon subunit